MTFVLATLSFFLLAQLPDTTLQNQKSVCEETKPAISRYINEKGWAVPGMEHLNQGRVLDRHEEIIDGQHIQVTKYEPVQEDTFSLHFHLPFVNITGNTATYEDIEAQVDYITEYVANGKPFCYLVIFAYVHTNYDKASGVTNVGYGGQSSVAFYDESGQGLLQTMEPANLLIDTTKKPYTRP